MSDLLTVTPSGIYCAEGGFYVDPWKPVDRAVITHAHADHARWGSKKYLTAATGRHVLQLRLGEKADVESLEFGESQTIGGVKVTLYPAGHILGSAQVKIERGGESAVVSGDYKRESDRSCRLFEPVRCNTFVTESTFGLPIYRWPEPELVFEQINEWWRSNQETGTCTMLLAYSLGKAQRLLTGIDDSIGPIYTHGAVEKMNLGYRSADIKLPKTTYVGDVDAKETDWSKALVVAPPAAIGGSWSRRFGKMSVGMASGWMQIRGTRRRRSMDRGFILSDHVDWESLLQTVKETEAENVWVTHGYTDVVTRYLNEQGLNAKVVKTEFVGETLVGSDSDAEEPADG